MSDSSKATDVSSLLGAILASMEDDAPRLALADYFDQQGDCRGELIRLQCRVDKHDLENPFRYPHHIDDHAARTLLEEQPLYKRGFREVQPGLWLSLRRGMLESVSVDVATILDSGADLLPVAEFPFLNRLNLRGETDRFKEFINSPFADRIRHLWFQEMLCGDAQIGLLAGTSRLKLKSLDCCLNSEEEDKQAMRDLGGVISPKGVETFARAVNFHELQSLNLSFHDAGAEGTRALFSSDSLPRWRPSLNRA